MLNPFRCGTFFSLVCFATYQGTQDSTVRGIKCLEFQSQLSVPTKLWTDPVLDGLSFTPAVTWIADNHVQPGHPTVSLLCWDVKIRVLKWRKCSIIAYFFHYYSIIFFTFRGKKRIFKLEILISHIQLLFCCCHIHSHSEFTLNFFVKAENKKLLHNPFLQHTLMTYCWLATDTSKLGDTR